MGTDSLVWLLAVSVAASALGGLLGMASGVFIVPILTMFGGFDIHTAIGASLISVIACSCGSAAPFLRSRLTNIRLAIVLETATTLGALTGVFMMGLIPVPALYGLFSIIMVISAQQMFARRANSTTPPLATMPEGWVGALRLDSTYPIEPETPEVAYRVQRVPLGMSFMYGAGLISALLGIGSGVLKIPAMDTALRLPIKVSSATSNFMIGVTAAASAGAYFVRGEIDPALAGPVAFGSVIGSIAGARLLIRSSNDRIRVLFVLVLLLLAGQMLLRAFDIDLSGLTTW